MPVMKMKSEDAKYATYGDLEGYELVTSDIIEEWRWGVLYTTVIKDPDGKFWSVTYRIQTGDNYYHEFEDSDEVEFTQVEPVEVVTIKYKPVKD
jgi:hypothetical protein